MNVPPLAVGDLHVWLCRLELPPAASAELERCLAPDELGRAARMRHELDRARYVAARGLLRRILAAYLGLEAATLCLEYGPTGKPELSAASNSAGIRFNLSHSQDLALFAFARGSRVGVDLERVREVRHADRVASRVFPLDELESWRTLPRQERTRGFFERWTRIEAIAKLHGGGVWWLVRNHRKDPLAGVTVRELTAPPGYVAAVAFDGLPARVLELDAGRLR